MEEAKEVFGSAKKSNCDSIATKEEGINLHIEISQDFRDGAVKEVEVEKKLDIDEANYRPEEDFRAID